MTCVGAWGRLAPGEGVGENAEHCSRGEDFPLLLSRSFNRGFPYIFPAIISRVSASLCFSIATGTP